MTETTAITPSEQAAHRAFEDWRKAKLKSDRTMLYPDCVVTAKAWARFQDLFVGSDAPAPCRNSTIVPFPRGFPDFGGAA